MNKYGGQVEMELINVINNEKVGKTNTENAIAAIISLLFSWMFLIKSQVHPWICDCARVDSSVFKTVALMMERGYMPYRDSFDHKGPVIYILNYLGNKIAYYWGIWVIELICASITIFVMYKIARLSSSIISSAVATLLALSLLFIYFEGGNFTEEYAMPCIAIATYIFLDYIKNYRLSKIRIILAGAGLGGVLMLRPNMIAVWIVFCIYIFVKLATGGKIKDLCNIIILFLIGMGIVILPILVWLALNNDLLYFWEDYIVFNMQYSTDNNISVKLAAFIKFSSTKLYFVSIFGLLYHMTNAKQRSVNIPYFIYMVTSVALIALSGYEFNHYGMVLIPVMVYPLSLIFYRIESVEQVNVKKALLMLVWIYALCNVILPNWEDVLRSIPKSYANRAEREFDSNEDVKGVLNCIEQYTDAEDSISVYGNYNIAYVLSERKHATRYSYQFPIGRVKPEILDEYFSQLQAEQPKAIVIMKDYHHERIENFIADNNYSKVWSADPEDSQSLAVYKK